MGALLLIVATAACSNGDGPPEPPPGARLTFEQVSFGARLGEILGHHAVAAELAAKGDHAAALVHAAHPSAEVFPALGPRIRSDDPGAADALSRALDAVSGAIRARKPAAEIGAAVREAADRVAAAEGAVVGELSKAPVYKGSVLATMLSTAALEYGESVQGGRVAAVDEYQDAYGFVRVAKRMFADVRPAVARAGAIEAGQIDEAFRRLEGFLPSPAPPAKPVRLEEVRAQAVLVAEKISETVGAVLEPERTPRQIVTRIHELLGRADAAYRRGDPAEADQLVAEAYLQNYEVIEVDVIRRVPAVNAELEPLLASRIRDRMQAKAPAAEVSSLISRARELLNRALEALITASP